MREETGREQEGRREGKRWQERRHLQAEQVAIAVGQRLDRSTRPVNSETVGISPGRGGRWHCHSAERHFPPKCMHVTFNPKSFNPVSNQWDFQRRFCPGGKQINTNKTENVIHNAN